MTDYSSDTSTTSGDSVSSLAEAAQDDFFESEQNLRVEHRLDHILRYDNGDYKYPFYDIRDPMVAIFHGRAEEKSFDDVMKRLNYKEKKLWTSLWNNKPVEDSNYGLDLDALDTMIEVGFRAAGDHLPRVYGVVCALLDARYNQPNKLLVHL